MAAAGIVLAAALGVDRAIGDPQSRLHPVALLGRFIGWWGDPGRWDPRIQRAAGLVCGIGTACLFSLPFLLVDRFAPLLGFLIVGPFLLKVTFAWRALEEHARAVELAVRDDLDAGRMTAGWMVSRETKALSKEETLSAAYESLSENLVDSITAPLLFFAFFSIFGLGLAAAAFYRASNTMDAMLGYRDERGRIGWFPARMDDVLTWIPARVTGLVLLGYFGAIGRLGPALTGLRKDARKRPGPNGGIPMAIMAGGTGVRFEKPGVYTMGPGEKSLAEGGREIIRALRAVTLILAAILVTALLLWV
ncbi:MAG TPA: adenosylcobinamide-phosphate synthase CbiB [Methanomicrobiales archaeon]|jgi:adenosylcobinamide-phosphate synthase|nr:adenosylcobinamide-phosphate synthase CbiB [Methanomicrobiales archaeon]